MTAFPSDLRYSRDHVWARLDPDGRITLGITDFVGDQSGEISAVKLLEAGDSVESGEMLGQIDGEESEWVVYSPLSGVCEEVNLECKDNPSGISLDLYGEGWFLVLKPSDPDEWEELLQAEEYLAFLEDFSTE